MWSGTGGFDLYDKRRLREVHFVLYTRCIWRTLMGIRAGGSRLYAIESNWFLWTGLLSSCKPHVLAMSISVLWFIGDGQTCCSQHERTALALRLLIV